MIRAGLLGEAGGGWLTSHIYSKSLGLMNGYLLLRCKHLGFITVDGRNPVPPGDVI